MKKFLMLFMLLGGFAACSDDQNDETSEAPTPTETLSFTGKLEAQPDPGSRFEAFSEQEITMQLQPTEGECYHLLMPEIKFVAQMPWLSIEVRDLKDTAEGASIRFEAVETIPYFMGAPYDAFPIANLSGLYDAATGEFTLVFDCNTMQVRYTGRK